MKNMAKWISLLALILALLVAQTAFADGPATPDEIFQALTAEDSDYSSMKSTYLEYYPEIQWEEELTEDGITIQISNSEYLDGSWTFSQEGDYLTATFAEGDYIGAMMEMYVVKAVGEALDMDVDVISGYVNGLSILDIENDNFILTQNEDAGTQTVQIRDNAAWDMKELDEMVLDENTLDYDPLDEDYTSISGNIGKVMMIANGNAGNVTILLGEYEGLDDLAYESLKNAVGILQPDGWESFLADYGELSDVETEAYTVKLDADMEEVAEIIDDAKESYQYAIIRFGNDQNGEF